MRPFIRWSSLAGSVSPGVERMRSLETEHLLVFLAEVAAGAQAPRMVHRTEQLAQMLAGEFRLVVEGEERVLTPDVLCVIGAGAFHVGEALGPGRIFEIHTDRDFENVWSPEDGERGRRPDPSQPFAWTTGGVPLATAFVAWSEVPELVTAGTKQRTVVTDRMRVTRLTLDPGNEVVQAAAAETVLQPLAGEVAATADGESATLTTDWVAVIPTGSSYRLAAANAAEILEVVAIGRSRE